MLCFAFSLSFFSRLWLQDLISGETIFCWAEQSQGRSLLSKSHQYLAFLPHWHQIWGVILIWTLISISSPPRHSAASPFQVVIKGITLASIHWVLCSRMWAFSSVQFSCSVMSDSLWPCELQHTRPPCPSPTPGVHSSKYQLFRKSLGEYQSDTKCTFILCVGGKISSACRIKLTLQILEFWL